MLPRASHRLSKIVTPINRLFDRLYDSQYNPLYRSGTLAVGFLAVLIITGLYLSFFYSISHPYESVASLQASAWSGRWVRALHRYATDGAIIATLFHVLQLLIQGKTWGPRTLAWLSGIFLTGALVISAWSGYVLVWDVHGQWVATAGAEMLQTFPFLRAPLGSAFNGSEPPNSSFFFMNLFLHVALPLGMFGGLWVHTARLARTIWFPERTMFRGSVAALFILAISWPAPLPRAADLLKMKGIVPVDIFCGFWLPLHEWSSTASFLFWTGLILFGATIPWWWKPKKNDIPGTSCVDQDACSGCTQCARDCPYEAIAMAPRPDGKKLLAFVSPELCVSCGICAASCDDRAIGPPGRTAHEQISRAENFQPKDNASQKSVVVVYCDRNGKIAERLSTGLGEDVLLYPVECCGTVHSDALETLLRKFSGAFLLGCPARNCTNRDGLVLVSERIFEKRVPFLSRTVDRRRIHIASAGDGEVPDIMASLEEFRTRIEDDSIEPKEKIRTFAIFRRAVVTAVILFLIAAGSAVPLGREPEDALVRVGTVFSGRAKEVCRAMSEEEKKAVPAHMQRPQICEAAAVSFSLSIQVDGVMRLKKVLVHSGARGDSPIFINEEVAVSAGMHEVRITLEPVDQSLAGGLTAVFNETIQAETGRIYLVHFDSGSSKLILT